MEENNSIVQINSLTKYYQKTKALSELSIDFPRGKIIGLLGPNGSGKTTLIKILTDMLHQYEGSVLIDGKKPGLETKKIISYLPDRNCLSPKWTVNDALAYFKDFFSDFNIEKAQKLIDDLHINRQQRFKELSKGTKEKVQLILILSREAELYIFDEPIAGVDPAARDLIFRLILENYNKKASILISTHLISEAETIFDYVVFLRKGQVALKNDVQTLKEKTNKTINEIFKEVYKYEVLA